MEQIRAFIAIELPEELKSKLAALRNRLSPDAPPGVKWVNPNSIHLTFKFLGNIPPDTTGAITEAIGESAEGIKPFILSTKELGTFPNPKRAQVAWVGLNGETDSLQTLQKRLEVSLVPLGFTPESRPFNPHLTLARLDNRISPAERQKFGERLINTAFDPSDIKVDAINLMKSQLSRTGAVYSRISSVRLDKR